MTHAYYVSHPQVAIDPAVPVPEWGLSDAGRNRLRQLAGRAWLASIGRVISSDEQKAIETAEALLPMTRASSVEVIADLHENDRSATGFLPPPEFEATADAFFAEPDKSVRGWERAVDAQSRIVSKVDAILRDHDPDTPILLIGHGGVGTLLKCHIKSEPITRSADQAAEGGHPGGGNAHIFTLRDRKHVLGWVSVEEVY